MDKLSREEVLHVAHLARISLTEEEIEKFRGELKVLMDDIDKIKEVEDFDDEMMYTPINDNTRLREDVVGEMLSASDATINAPKKNGSFIEVPVMINE
ncbi:MAG TPA: Asp-tRNA(Asn)/Glu-tRNA(Gln) amidotransferase subunit GatC [Candidatus Onthousia faecipullorum]|uniref:Aspartyl/glutamyl-tRNA(Asn/Gln) amidotransferase subunit C n=1 Tax=Candidatus Onthousia faecipullorum TaxID=2840887 RepID=A0A9D1GC61_9FIRM|nr:Asp-tRNA(Asn)/Glu-tRNA(Gln) amidotransferase subunit GatC [Candidatus Onthousia faecipullorum]